MGTKKYLAILKAREPYTFSTDQKSVFWKDDEARTGKESYFIKSNVVPEQTTIWGMMRLLLLEQNDKVNSDYEYSAEQISEIESIIGKESFRFDAENQEFGRLQRISPVFIVKEDSEDSNNEKYQYIISNPFCNTIPSGGKGFKPYEMTASKNYADNMMMSMPKGYDPKEGYVGGFVNLSTKEIISGEKIFKSVVQTNSRKNEEGRLAAKEEDSGGFFKRERYVMEDAYSFAFFVEVNDEQELKADFVTIGAGKNVFSIQFIEDLEDTLEEKVKVFLGGSDNKWHYALSDVVFKDTPKYNEFSMVQFRYLRNLTTDYKQSSYNRFKRSDGQIKLIQSGSVFYKGTEEIKLNPNAKKLGYNRIV